MPDPAETTEAALRTALPAVLTSATAEHPRSTSGTGSRLVGLVAGAARVGITTSTLLAAEITSRTVKVARIVLPAGIAEGPLETIEQTVGRSQLKARGSEQRSLDDLARTAESALNRVVVGFVDMMDMEALIDHVPINRVVARIDLPEVIDEIDLAGTVREATKGLGGETLDSTRVGLMAMDQWSARFIDRILRRKQPRDLAVTLQRQERPNATTGQTVT